MVVKVFKTLVSENSTRSIKNKTWSAIKSHIYANFDYTREIISAENILELLGMAKKEQ